VNGYGAFADSGWISASNTINNAIVINHSLGAIPTFVSVMFSPDKVVAYSCTRMWSQKNDANPVTIELTSTTITLNLVRSVPLFGAWKAMEPDGVWTHWNTGYFRVCATK
jgi:hypothetical protein